MKFKPIRVSQERSNKTKTIEINGKTIYQPKLNNAQHLARKHPDTFGAPSKEELDSIRIGSLVKIGFFVHLINLLTSFYICDGEERFWVKIIKTSKKYLIGEIDNVLFCGQDYSNGDLILFKKTEIYEVYSD